MNKNLLVISIIAVVNALGYGIIIPILYPYSIKFGLSDFGNGMLFAVFSLAQFFATPVIGRLSDKYGRKPLLLISLIGTFISFLMMASARSIVWLFIARILDGLTAGNIPVAQAVISDTTDEKNRGKGFAIMGAAFGFGFVVGPAISGFTSHLGLWVPFAIAATVTAVAVVLTAIILPETNKHMGEIKKGKMFDLKKIATAIFDKNSGRTLTISLIYSLAFAMFIYAYQPMANKGLGLTPAMVAANFSIIGVMGIVGQMVVVPFLVKRFSEKKILVAAFLLQALTFVGFAMVGGWWSLIFVSILNSLSGAPIGPLINSILSKDADKASQGSILGLNASYIGLGNIFGPVVGGFLATIGLRLPFVIGGVLVALCSTITMKLAIKKASVHEF